MDNLRKAQVGIVSVGVPDSIEFSLRKALNLIESRALPSHATVVIKPNLCRPMSPETGATVDTRIIEALIRILRKQEHSCKIVIVESDTNVRSAEEVFDRQGYFDLANQYDIKLVNLTKDRRFPVTVPVYNKSISFPYTLMSCDYFISVAKMKTYRPYHRITCNMKNLFGCVPQKYKVSLHPFLPELTTGLCLLLNPDLCIVDGIIGMEGAGPISGKPKQMNLLICGNDPISTDFVVAKIVGFNPYRVPMIRCAMRHGVARVDNIEVRGKQVEEVCSKFDYRAPIEVLLMEFIGRCGLAMVRLSSRIKDFADTAYPNPLLFADKYVPRFIFYRLRAWAVKRYRKRGSIPLS